MSHTVQKCVDQCGLANTSRAADSNQRCRRMGVYHSVIRLNRCLRLCFENAIRSRSYLFQPNFLPHLTTQIEVTQHPSCRLEYTTSIVHVLIWRPSDRSTLSIQDDIGTRTSRFSFFYACDLSGNVVVSKCPTSSSILTDESEVSELALSNDVTRSRIVSTPSSFQDEEMKRKYDQMILSAHVRTAKRLTRGLPFIRVDQ